MPTTKEAVATMTDLLIISVTTIRSSVNSCLVNIGIYKKSSLVCVLSGLLLVALMITDLMGEMNTLTLSVRNFASISAIK